MLPPIIQCPYPRPTHPKPITAEQIEADLLAAKAQGKRAVYQLWDGESASEVIIANCIYGFPSCVIVDFSYGSGVKSESWDCYGTLRDTLDRQQDYLDMYQWLATKITQRATGSQFAVGEFSDITVAFQ